MPTTTTSHKIHTMQDHKGPCNVRCDGLYNHFNAIFHSPLLGRALSNQTWTRRGGKPAGLIGQIARMTALGANRARAPRAAVDGIDLVCPQVHCRVHMRDLPPPRETRSAAALIGREGYRPYYVGAGDSELWGIVTLTKKQNGASRWFIETSFNVPQDRQISP